MYTLPHTEETSDDTERGGEMDRGIEGRMDGCTDERTRAHVTPRHLWPLLPPLFSH